MAGHSPVEKSTIDACVRCLLHVCSLGSSLDKKSVQSRTGCCIDEEGIAKAEVRSNLRVMNSIAVLESEISPFAVVCIIWRIVGRETSCTRTDDAAEF